MGSPYSFLTLACGAALAALPAVAAQYEKTGAWVFDSAAFAEDGEKMLYACSARTESADGTGLVLRLEPAGGTVAAELALSNDAWALDAGPVRVRFDIGADHWVLPGDGAGAAVAVSWTGDAAFLTFVEALASSSFAGLAGRDGATIAQFSLKGSRGAIEAMKACAEEQIGQGLDALLAPDAGGGASGAANPF